MADNTAAHVGLVIPADNLVVRAGVGTVAGKTHDNVPARPVIDFIR